MERPIILCGLGRMGIKVLEYLKSAGLPVVIVDTQCKPDDPRLDGTPVIVGDCRRREVLEAAGVREARGVLVLTADDLLNITTVLTVRSLNPDVRVVLRMFNQHLIGRLGSTIRNVYALSTSLLTAPILALTALTGQALGTFTLEGRPDGRRQIVEVPIGTGNELRGRTVGEVISLRDAVAVAHLRQGEPGSPEQHFLLDVNPAAHLQPGDRLVVCGQPRALAGLLASAGQVDTSELLWARWPKRMYRVVRRTLAEIDKPVLICALVLVLVIVLSTLVLHFGVNRSTVPHAFLRAVSIVATAGAIPGGELREAPWLEVFVSVLRIVGALVMAAFIAIFTNYLLRARLGGAFELRRIPESGHHIVCGLDSVGFRVVEELVGYGERVVAIERDRDNRFIVTARRLGAAVIVGDAAVAEVLRQANASTAHSIIAATNNDLTNLAVALLVRESNPRQRVVLLLSDPQFAQMMRDSAQVQLAASVPALAAPAFVAGLFGDRVLGIFRIDDRLFAVIDLVIQEGDPFAGQAVRAVAVDYRVQPVAVLPCQGPAPRILLPARLAVGDRLVAIASLADLEPLLRRQPRPAVHAVEVTECPIPTRGWLVGLTRMLLGLGLEDAERAVDRLPMRIASRLTRGQAEDLLAQLLRERVSAKLIEADAPVASTT